MGRIRGLHERNRDGIVCKARGKLEKYVLVDSQPVKNPSFRNSAYQILEDVSYHLF